MCRLVLQLEYHLHLRSCFSHELPPPHTTTCRSLSHGTGTVSHENNQDRFLGCMPATFPRRRVYDMCTCLLRCNQRESTWASANESFPHVRVPPHLHVRFARHASESERIAECESDACEKDNIPPPHPPPPSPPSPPSPADFSSQVQIWCGN